MELRQLRYFVAVAEERNFSRAAERLHLAQSGLSQQIKALETSLGTTLFVRDRRPLELTPAGEALLDPARLIIDMADRVRETVRRIGPGRRGPLKLATAAGGLPPVAVEVIRAFEERFPDVEVELFPGFAAQNIDALDRRVVDVAFVGGPEASGRAPFLRLGAMEVLVMMREDHPLSRHDRVPRSALVHHPFATWPRHVDPVLMDHVHGLLFGRDGTPDVVEMPDVSTSTRLRAVRDSDAVAIALQQDVDLALPGVVYRPLEPPAPIVEYGIAWMDPPAGTLVGAFVDVAREHVAEDRGLASA